MHQHAPASSISLRTATLSLLLAAALGGCQSAFFYPAQQHYGDPAEAGLVYEEVRFASADGTALHGWFLPAQSEPVHGTVIHFHGNAQNISTHVGAVWWLPRHGFNVLTFDYRGYGRSAGEPDFAGVHADAEAALEWAQRDPRIALSRTVVLGQSLGASVAITSLARWAGPSPAGVVAEGPFASYRGIAREKLAGFWLTWPLQYPLSWLVSDRFAPVDHVAALAPVPLLVIVGGDDPIIPAEHGERLYGAAREPRYLWRIEGAKHGAALADPQVRERLVATLRGWLEGAPDAARQAPAGPWDPEPPRP